MENDTNHTYLCFNHSAAPFYCEYMNIAGKETVTISIGSTIITILFCFSLIMLYQGFSFKLNRKDALTMLTIWDRMCPFVFCTFCVIYEIILSYASYLPKKHNISNNPISIEMVWITCNLTSCLILFMASFSVQSYRMLIYMVYIVHLNTHVIICVLKICANEVEVDMLMSVVMFILSTWMVYNVPLFFKWDGFRSRITYDRLTEDEIAMEALTLNRTPLTQLEDREEEETQKDIIMEDHNGSNISTTDTIKVETESNEKVLKENPDALYTIEDE